MDDGLKKHILRLDSTILQLQKAIRRKNKMIMRVDKENQFLINRVNEIKRSKLT